VQPLDGLTAQLAGSGFVVTATRDLDRAVRMLRDRPPALVVVHGADGIEEATACLRLLCDRPLLVIDEHLSEESVISALGAGADAVLRPPFSNRELSARIEALLRRSSAPSHRPDRTPRHVELGDLVIDTQARLATKAGRPLRLRPTGFRLLATLASRAGRTVTHEELLSEVWGTTLRPGSGQAWDGGRDALRPHVRQLRRQLESAGGEPQRLISQRSVGYRLGSRSDHEDDGREA
jgi:two-component system KDP operon response regulator KdpE